MTYKTQHILVGIAAYNAEKNIQNLLMSLVRQKEEAFSFDILVFSDCSTDRTVSLSKEIQSTKLKVVDNKNRGGFAGAVKYILSQGLNYDATLILNDDIYINDTEFLIRLIKPLLNNDNLGLITGNPMPVKPTNFIERAAVSSFNIYNKIRYLFRDGNNKWTCDGKVLFSTNKFIRALALPENNDEVGNVDDYLYFSCLKLNFKYLHVRDAIVHYKMPSTLNDYLKWDSRNKSNKYLLAKKFGPMVDREHYIPQRTLIYYSFLELFKNPFGVLFLFFSRFYTKIKAKEIAKNFTSTWDVITTTKEANK